MKHIYPSIDIPSKKTFDVKRNKNFIERLVLVYPKKKITILGNSKSNNNSLKKKIKLIRETPPQTKSNRNKNTFMFAIFYPIF